MTKKLDDRPAPFTWRKLGKELHPDGPRTIYQAQENPAWVIASWRHPIPHANGVGSWDHITFLIYYSGTLVHREETTLINAKLWVEAHKGSAKCLSCPDQACTVCADMKKDGDTHGTQA